MEHIVTEDIHKIALWLFHNVKSYHQAGQSTRYPGRLHTMGIVDLCNLTEYLINPDASTGDQKLQRELNQMIQESMRFVEDFVTQKGTFVLKDYLSKLQAAGAKLHSFKRPTYRLCWLITREAVIEKAYWAEGQLMIEGSLAVTPTPFPYIHPFYDLNEKDIFKFADFLKKC